MKTHTSKKAILLRSFLLLPLLAMLVYGFSSTEVKTIPVYSDNQPNVSVESLEEGEKRTIEFSGLILDSETMLPLENAEIFNADGSLLTTTDKQGYYKTKINIFTTGEIHFDFSLQKKGYKTLTQNEHWGDLSGRITTNFYFGLSKTNSNSSAFSELQINAQNLSYESTLSNFDPIKKQLQFDKKIDRLKQGNQNVFMGIDANYYIVNETGWIKINSKDDLISINNTKIVSAANLNTLIKRREITGMTPLEPNEKTQFLIYTIDKKATEKQLTEYNALAKKYNAMMKKKHYTIKLTDVERLKYLYNLLSDKQKATAEPFPEFPPVPEPSSFPDFHPTDSLMTFEKMSNTLKKESVELKKQGLLLKKEGERLRKEGQSLKIEAAKLQHSIPRQPPVAPKPISPEDFINTSAKKGAVFYYKNKEITKKEALNLVKRNKDKKDIFLGKLTNSSDLKINISITPKTKSSATYTAPNIIKYAKELANKNAQFYFNNIPISASAGITLIEEKKYTSVETLPYVTKKPEIKIYNELSGSKLDKTNTDIKTLKAASERGVALFFKNNPVSLSDAVNLINKNSTTYGIVTHANKYKNKSRIDILTDVNTEGKFSSQQYESINF